MSLDPTASASKHLSSSWACFAGYEAGLVSACERSNWVSGPSPGVMWLSEATFVCPAFPPKSLTDCKPGRRTTATSQESDFGGMAETDSAPPHAEPLCSCSDPQVTKVGFLASKENWQWVQEYSERNGISLSTCSIRLLRVFGRG